MFDSIEFLYTRLSTVENSIHVIDYFSLSYILIGRRISRYIIRYDIIILVIKIQMCTKESKIGRSSSK